jgi:ABC-type glycerol-3-phosphate transport system substrate-binding protein
MLFSRGGQFFDEKLTPAFVGEGSVLAEHMKWVREALDQKLMDPESLTRDAVANQQAMMAGTQVYGLTRASGLAFWQDKAKSKEGGNFEIIPMPGKTHETLGFVRFYGVTKQLAARDQTAKDGAWKFLSYFGGPGPDGSWPVVRRWALEHGLGFGPMPLFKDAAIRESFGNWTDVPALEEMCKQAKTRKLSPWYASWDVFTRAELQRAYLGRTDVDAAVNNIAERWKTVQAEFAE